jgi:hypothetical protein
VSGVSLMCEMKMEQMDERKELEWEEKEKVK